MKKIKVGIFGAGRGMDIAENFMLLNCDIVALCDWHKERRESAAARLGDGVAVYDNFDAFIEHDMDAVIVANYFHEHAPYVIRCFEKGIHVFCECISNGTLAEGVALVRAAEKTNSIFFFAENYPQMLFNREIYNVCKGGTLGKILYAEGEYNHPGSVFDIEFKKRYNYFEKHWRNFLPRTYYVTHSLGPIMRATGATPKRVSASTVFAPVEGNVPTASYDGDKAAIIITQNDDGSVFRFTGCAAFGGHGNSYRVCGTKGQIENIRGLDDKVVLQYNEWEMPEGAERVKMYTPSWNDKDEEFIKTSGHGGGDYITARLFLDCIKENKQPEFPYDLYSAVNMSSVAILAHRSMLDGGTPYDIPDFRLEENRKKYENDTLSPCYLSDGTPPTLPVCSHTDFKPTEEQLAYYRKVLDIK